MQLRVTDTLAGYAPDIVRTFLRSARFDSLSEHIAMQACGFTRNEARVFIAALESAGYIEKNSDGNDRWRETSKGGSIRRASFAKPLTRATGTKRLEELLERVKIVNASTVYAYRVKKVILFGSLLGERSRIGDVDVSVELVRKETDIEAQRQLDRARISEAQNKGRRFDNYLNLIFWPREEVLLFLKSRSRALQFTHPDDETLKTCEHKVVYQLKEAPRDITSHPSESTHQEPV